MLKEISLFASIVALNLNPASSTPKVSKEFMNSTDYVIHVNESASVQAHSLETFTLEPVVFTDMYIDVFNETEPTGVYYWLNQVDNEQEVLVTWTRVPVGGTPRWEFDIPDLSSDTIKGIQFFTRHSLVGETYYISQPSIANSTLNSGNILPTDSNASLERYNTTAVNISSLALNRTRVDRGMIGYVELSIDNAVVIASNSRTGHATYQLEELSNLVAYYGSYTNKLTFTHGDYPRVYNTQGYSKHLAYLSDEYVSYVSFASSTNVGETLAPLETGFKIMGKVFEAMNSFLSYTLLPGITIGVVIAIPLIVLLILFILKLIKKG